MRPRGRHGDCMPGERQDPGAECVDCCTVAPVHCADDARAAAHRIAFLVLHRNVPASSVLAITFTRKAAREMAERLNKFDSAAMAAVNTGTFHATCCTILRRFGRAIGLDPSFGVADAEDQKRLLGDVMARLKLDKRQYSAAKMRDPISRIKNRIESLSTCVVQPV